MTFLLITKRIDLHDFTFLSILSLVNSGLNVPSNQTSQFYSTKYSKKHLIQQSPMDTNRNITGEIHLGRTNVRIGRIFVVEEIQAEQAKALKSRDQYGQQLLNPIQ